ncbi:hypothetical protein KSS87_000329 [Heliosperma pusillum]|nr:hypothetical protein KSS87_000329 [Heliosperma pusillum]
MDSDRINLPDTSVVKIDLLGHQLHFSQEKNSRKGRFCPSKLKGKRVIELGAGCGVAGFGMAMLGCDVITTDQKEVVPLLQRNVKRNISTVMQANGNLDSFGSIKVAELDWGNNDHLQAVDPPFDYVIGTDVVYAEHLLDPLLQTICALSGPRTTIVLGYEIRSTTVHEKMLQMWKENFDVKTVPRAKMDSKYQHESIQLFVMGTKTCGTAPGEDLAFEGMEKKSKEDGQSREMDEDGLQKDCSPSPALPDRDLTDWEARRCGAMAARLLRDVKIN